MLTRSVRVSSGLRNGSIRAFSSSKVACKEELYTDRQAKTGRPVSPHVTIYKFPVVSISSITNRVTGVMLSIGVSGIGAGALAGLDVPGAMMMLGQSPVGPVLKFGVAFPLVYHYLGGVRHIMWDKAPEKLTNENVETSSQVLIGSAVALSAGIAML